MAGRFPKTKSSLTPSPDFLSAALILHEWATRISGHALYGNPSALTRFAIVKDVCRFV